MKPTKPLVTITCPRCGGTGEEPGAPMSEEQALCMRCQGKGEVRGRLSRYVVRRYWQMCDSVEVEAVLSEHAVTLAHTLSAHGTNAQYVPDSMNSDPEDDVQEVYRG